MTFLDALNAGRTLLMDGAMGTELIRRGFAGPTWRANLEAPELVRAIHADFADAGAEVLLTNTFAVPLGCTNTTEVGPAAVQLARSSNGPRWLLGSVGPAATGVNFPDREELLAIVAALWGVDGVLLETCSDASAFEAAAWIRNRWPTLPVLLSFAFAPKEEAKALEMARIAAATEIAALGVNCGREQTPADVGRLVGLFRRETSKPIFARPNAGMPTRQDKAWGYPLGPSPWAEETARLMTLGLAMVGGCCGVSPEHIRELRRTL